MRNKIKIIIFSIDFLKSGFVHYINTIKEGVNVQLNQTLAEISELEKNTYYVESYINISDISKIREKQDVDVAIIGENAYRYGTLKGKIFSIEKGVFTSQTPE